MKTTPEDGTLDPETGAPTVPLARLRQAERERDEAQRHAAALESELATRDGPLVDRLEALEAERDDLRLQRDELLRAVAAWCGFALTREDSRIYHAGLMLTDARDYCRWTPAERARDAEERAGQAAAADEAALRYGG